MSTRTTHAYSYDVVYEYSLSTELGERSNQDDDYV